MNKPSLDNFVINIKTAAFFAMLRNNREDGYPKLVKNNSPIFQKTMIELCPYSIPSTLLIEDPLP